jgi:flagellar M-ring protein FliF
VGVLINERPIPAGMKVEKAADGSTPTTIPYTQEELERLNQLVRGAVGFKEDRGDVVTVVSTRFEPQIDPDAVPWYKDESIAGMANSAVVALLFLLFLFLVVRPMVRKLTTPEFDPAAIASAAADAAAREASAGERLKAERIAMAVAEAAAKAVSDKAAVEAEAEAKAKEQAERQGRDHGRAAARDRNPRWREPGRDQGAHVQPQAQKAHHLGRYAQHRQHL